MPRRGLNKEGQTHLRASLSLSAFGSISLSYLSGAQSCSPLSELPPPACWAPRGFGPSDTLPSKAQRSPAPSWLLQPTVLMGCASRRTPTRFLGLPGPAVLDTGGHGARTCLPAPPRWLGLASAAGAEPGKMAPPGQVGTSSSLPVSRQCPETQVRVLG